MGFFCASGFDRIKKGTESKSTELKFTPLYTCESRGTLLFIRLYRRLQMYRSLYRIPRTGIKAYTGIGQP
jgi:hypothetical protein